MVGPPCWFGQTGRTTLLIVGASAFREPSGRYG
jgi:hypothetical protein